MDNGWTHIGRLWTNGEPYLAVDSDVRRRWLGFSEDEYFDRIVDLDPGQIGIDLGDETAAVVGADGVVREDSWMEVFESSDGTIAIVQASSDDYQHSVDAALRYADTSPDAATLITVGSGELAIFSAACDGVGEYSMALLPAQPGQTPAQHGPPSPDADSGLLLTARSITYRVQSRSYTQLDNAGCFARWLLIPQQPIL